jgi:hypothetical protein
VHRALGLGERDARLLRGAARARRLDAQQRRALVDRVDRLEQAALLALVGRDALAARRDRGLDPLEVRVGCARAAAATHAARAASRDAARDQRRASAATAIAEPSSPSPRRRPQPRRLDSVEEARLDAAEHEREPGLEARQHRAEQRVEQRPREQPAAAPWSRPSIRNGVFTNERDAPTSDEDLELVAPRQHREPDRVRDDQRGGEHEDHAEPDREPAHERERAHVALDPVGARGDVGDAGQRGRRVATRERSPACGSGARA